MLSTLRPYIVLLHVAREPVIVPLKYDYNFGPLSQQINGLVAERQRDFGWSTKYLAGYNPGAQKQHCPVHVVATNCNLKRVHVGKMARSEFPSSGK